jgi:hypothetical protein
VELVKHQKVRARRQIGARLGAVLA